MTKRHDPLQQYREAQQIARDYGMFIVEKPDSEKVRYLVYRRTTPRNVFLGFRGSVEGLRKFVESCSSQPTRRAA